jgi:hypothetical protein
VTFNIRHFPADRLSPFKVTCIEPDAFVLQLIDINLHKAVYDLHKMRERLRKPAQNVDEFLNTLTRQKLPATPQKLQDFRDTL